MLVVAGFRFKQVVATALFWSITILFFIDATIAETSVSVTLPITPVRPGDNVTIECQVFDTPPNHVVAFHRPNQLPITWNSTLFSQDERLAIDVNPGGVYMLTIADVTEEDEGEYICQVIDPDQYNVLAKEEIELKLSSFYYFPESNPVCEITVKNPIAEGSNVTMTCTSDDGNPPIMMDWTISGSSLDVAAPIIRKDGTITSSITFTASLDDDRKVYLCYITSVHFPRERGSCYLSLVVKRGIDIPDIPDPSDVQTTEAFTTGTPNLTVTEAKSEAFTTNTPTVAGTKAVTTEILTTSGDYGTDTSQSPEEGNTLTSTMDTLTSVQNLTTTNYFFPDSDPQCTTSMSPVSLTEGSTMTLTCTSSEGNPPVSITWSKPGSELRTPSTHTLLGLLISQITYTVALEDDGAMITCNVNSTQFPDLSRNCSIGPLQIQSIPSTPLPAVSTESTTVEGTPGSTLDLLTSTDVPRSTYPNYFFPSTPPSCSPIFQDPVSVGSTVTVSCTTEDGNPPVSIEWAKSGRRLPIQILNRSDGYVTSEVTFAASLDDDNAVFVCSVSSTEFPESIQVCFIGPLKVRQVIPPPLPITTSSPVGNDYYFPDEAPICRSTSLNPIIEGSTVTLTCISDPGNPPVYLYWEKSGSRVLASSTSSSDDFVASEVTFQATLEDQGALYACYVRSSQFPDSFQTCYIEPLQIRQILSRTTITPAGNNFYFPDEAPLCESTSPNPITEGSLITFSCTSYEGNPPVNLDWVKAGVRLQVSPPRRSDGFAVSEVTFRVTREDDGIVYVCYVSSSEFPELYQSCYIGPLQVISSPIPPSTTTQTPDVKYTSASGEYFPNTAPLCQSSLPSPITEGYTYTLSCTSYEGNPPVVIDWAKSGARVQAPPPRRSDGFVTSEITLRARLEDNNAVYICYVTSPGFPELYETCFIGPLEIQANPYLPLITTQSPDVYNTMVMMTPFVGQANKTANVMELCEQFCSTFPDVE